MWYAGGLQGIQQFRYCRLFPMDAEITKPRKEIIGSLTGIKFFLSVLVILSNMMLYIDVNPGFAQYLYVGHFASFITVTFRVDVFFMITGFLLMHLYADKFADGVHWPNFKHFLIVRVARLYPLYLFVLGVIVLLYITGIWGAIGPGSPERIIAPLGWLYNLTLTTAWGFSDVKVAWNGPAWSVSAEFFNYITFPFYLYLIVRCKGWRTQIAAISALSIVYGLLQFYFIQDYIVDFGYGSLVRANFGMLAGALSYGLYQHLKKMKGEVWDILFMLNLLLIIGLMAAEGYELFAVPKITYMVALIFMVLTLSLATGFVSRFLSHPVMMFLGKLSFAMYLLHQPVIRLMRYFLEDRYVAIAANDYQAIVGHLLLIFAVIIFLSYLAHICIETPARYKLRDKFGIKTVEVRL